MKQTGVNAEPVRDGYSELLRRGYSRRQVMRFGIAAVVVPAAFLEGCGGSVTGKQASLDQVLGLSLKPQTFDTAQLRAVQAVLARLIPSDASGPGATEAMVWRYIDRALAQDYRELKPVYVANLAALDKYATQQHGKAYADVATVHQDAVLSAIQAGRAPGFTPTSAAFFGLLREHALEGMFCDPYHGGNANFVGWNLIGFPGILDVNPAAYQEIGVAIPPARRSVAQFDGMFRLDGSN